MKKWTKKMRRITAFILTIILLGTSVNLPVMAEEDSQLALLEEKVRKGYGEEDKSMVLPDAVLDDIFGDVSDREEEPQIPVMSEATEGLVFTEADNQSELIAAVDSGENVRLTANITLTESIEIHTSLTVDLNGQTVTGAENASVFEVTGSGVEVVFTDSSVDEAGMVTAVGTGDIPVAVRAENEASVSIEKGTYAGGYAPLQVEETGSVIVNGGTLDGVGAYYAAANWGGNLTISDGTFQVDGGCVIFGHSGATTLTGGSFITTTPGLACYAMSYNSGTLNLSNFTESGYQFYFGNAPEENQVSIPEGYAWFDSNNTPDNEINAGDGLTLSQVLTVSFAANGGSGTMASESAMAGEYWLPECEFTAPEGLSFLGWATASDGKAITDDYYKITENTTFYAIWGKVYDVYVGGVGMEDGDYLPSNETEVSAVQPTTGGYAYYKDGNLTLNHYVYSGEGYWYYVGSDWEYSSVVYSTKNLTVTLEGENKLANTAYEGNGIVVEGDLTISGTGTMELETDYCGIACYSGEEADGNVVIESGTISIDADAAIYTVGDFAMNGGALDIMAYWGIDWCSNVVINDGLLSIEANDTGIYTSGTVVIYNGYVDIAAYVPVFAEIGILFDEEVVELLCPSGGSVYDAGGYYIVDANNYMVGRVIIGSAVEHIWSTDYVYNHEAHWHICTDEDCFLAEDNTLYAFVEGSGYGVHDTNGANGICSACGYNASKEVAIYVGDLGLAVGEYLDNSGRISTEQPSTGGYAYYTDGVLTLKDYAYTGTGYAYEENESTYSAAVYCGLQELKLVLQGENQLTNTFTNGDSIYCAGGLVIEGDSITLIAEGDGIDLDGNLDINSGTISIMTKDDGIDVDEDVTITINDGTLTIEADDNGIDSAGDFIVNGGEVNITSATADCVDVQGMITIRGGVITLNADNEGLESSEDILIEGGMIIMNTEDCGILAYEDVTINGGVLTITSNLDTVEEVDPAIKVSGNLNLGEQVEIQIPEGGVVATLEEHVEATAYYNIIADAEGQTATYVVMKEKLQLRGDMTLVKNTLTYGEALSTLEFGEVEFVNYVGDVIEGTLSWKSPEDTPDVTVTSATWVFTPKDEVYDPVEGTVAITVKKAVMEEFAIVDLGEITYFPGGAERTLIETTGAPENSVVTISVPADNGVIELDEDNYITILNAGTVVITAVCVDLDGNYEDATATYELTIHPYELEASQITWETGVSGVETYDGVEKKPAIWMYMISGPLSEGTDYIVSYVNNTDAYTLTEGEEGFDANKAPAVVVTGKGNYSGTVKKYFVIEKAVLSDVSVVQKGTLTYTGTAQSAQVETKAVSVNNQPVSFTYSVAADGIYGSEVPGFTEVGTYTVYYRAEAANHEVYEGSFEVRIGVAEIMDVSSVLEAIVTPEAGAVPQGSVNVAAGAGYSANIVWSPTAEKFGYSTVYKATVTLTAEATHVFAENVAIGTYSLVSNDGQVLVVSYTYPATRKAKIVSVGRISDVVLTKYYAGAAEVIATLPTTVKVVTESEPDGKDMAISWKCENYNRAANAKNTFVWSITVAEYAAYDVNSKTMSGSIMVTNAQALENPITAQDKEITYDGSKVDVSELFTVVEGAGEVVYTIAEGGSGVGTLEGSMLTITKVGTILIQAEVAANPIFVPGSETAVATLTVNKGEGVASVSIAGWRYNQTPSVPVVASETNSVENVTYFYKEKGATDDTYVTEVPVMVGEYTIKAVLVENDLYKEAVATADFLLDIPFEDVDRESWQYKGIFHVFRIGLMKGVSDTKFKPNDNFTREQMAMVLYSHAGKPVVEFSEKFTDVKDGNWYSEAVTWAAMKGIAAGYPDGSFGVGKSITREEFVVMLYKYAKQSGMVTEVPSGELSNFVDADSVSSWAKEAMLWATQKGMLTGKPVSTGGYRIDPQGTATRAECATILMKFTMQ